MSLRLKYLANVIAGQSPSSDEVHVLEAGRPFVQGNAEFGKLYPAAKYECSSAPKVAAPGDVLMSVRAPVGSLNMANTYLGIGRGLCAVRPLSGSAKFYYWWLHAKNSELNSLATGSTFAAVTTEVIAGLLVDVIDPNEQQAIADFLDRETAAIDAFIADQEKLIALLEERRRSALHAFTAAAKGAPKVRLRYLYRPSRAANRPDLEVLSVYRDYGVVKKSSRADNFNKTPEDTSRYLVVHPKYLVVNKMKAWQGSLGVSSYDGIVSPDYEVLAPLTEDLSPAYVHHILRSAEYVADYAVRSVGIRPSQWRLYWDQLKDITITVPSRPEQLKFLDKLQEETFEIDATVAEAREAIALSKERRAAVISAAVTGKIDVRGLIIPASTNKVGAETVGVA